jgi:hypothetical protein
MPASVGGGGEELPNESSILFAPGDRAKMTRRFDPVVFLNLCSSIQKRIFGNVKDILLAKTLLKIASVLS